MENFGPTVKFHDALLGDRAVDSFGCYGFGSECVGRSVFKHQVSWALPSNPERRPCGHIKLRCSLWWDPLWSHGVPAALAALWGDVRGGLFVAGAAVCESKAMESGMCRKFAWEIRTRAVRRPPLDDRSAHHLRSELSGAWRAGDRVSRYGLVHKVCDIQIHHKSRENHPKP